MEGKRSAEKRRGWQGSEEEIREQQMREEETEGKTKRVGVEKKNVFKVSSALFFLELLIYHLNKEEREFVQVKRILKRGKGNEKRNR